MTIMEAYSIVALLTATLGRMPPISGDMENVMQGQKAQIRLTP